MLYTYSRFNSYCIGFGAYHVFERKQLFVKFEERKEMKGPSIAIKLHHNIFSERRVCSGFTG